MGRKAKKSSPVIIAPIVTKQMAQERLDAVEITKALRKKTATNEDINYFLSLLADFDQTIRPTVNKKSDAHGGLRYRPIQLYDTLMSYFHLSLSNGRNMTLGHMSWYCGMSRDSLMSYLKDGRDPDYYFLRDFVSFLEAHMEYIAQDKQNPAFHIFWLKNRGWKDKFEIEASSTQGALSDAQRAEAQEMLKKFGTQAHYIRM